MREFILGTLASIWFILLGLGSVHHFITIASVIYPIVVGLLVFNYYMIKKIIMVHMLKENKITRH